LVDAGFFAVAVAFDDVGFLATTFFFAAAFAFVVDVAPVTDFLAVPRFAALVDFFVDGADLAFPARVFLVVAAGLLIVVDFAPVLVDLTDFVAGLLTVLVLPAAGFFPDLVVVVLETGLEFSLEASFAAGLFLGASLTFPEGPLGRWKSPDSAPVVMARFS